ncbi:MAG: bifunctional molybdenum cofactor biosynthesis protein MoaC/MoaB [Bdellovibrionales bacterium]|nr:bifunctional molybdenum cofactor biosynthesis protein MoaC/MoaB [Bdellovibrionales bacterium]
MIDVGEKADTRRRAVASGRLFARPETIRMIRDRAIPKGDVLSLAEMAGIQAAKSTANLLPLCHPLPLHAVRVWTEVSENSVLVSCEAVTTGKTGVEMEALTGVSVALLCVYDLTKVVDPCLELGEVRLELKEGGKSGVWRNPRASRNPLEPATDLSGQRVCLLTVSDRCSRGESDDVSGRVLGEWFRERGAAVAASGVVPDEVHEIVRHIEGWLETERPDLVISTGGTGMAPRDRTPEAFREMAAKWGGREVPGVGELLRSRGAVHTPMSWLSRSLGVMVGRALLVALPGNPKAVKEGLEALAPLLSHAVHIGGGGDHVGIHRVRG